MKGFTALAVVSLVEDGTLELTTTARSLLGDDLPLIADDVTIEHLLAHRSGIGDYFDEDVETRDNRLPAAGARPPARRHRGLRLGARRVSDEVPGRRALLVLQRRLRRARAARGAREWRAVPRARRDSACASRPGCRTRRSCARTSCRVAPRSAISPRTVFARTCSICRCAAPATVASTRRLRTCARSGKRCSRAGSSPASGSREMTRPRSDSPEDDRRYGLGFWLHGTTDAVMLEGYDAGVSFRSLHDPVAGRDCDGHLELEQRRLAAGAPARDDPRRVTTFRLDRLDHVSLNVSDRAASIAWYRDVLGLEQRNEPRQDDWPVFMGEFGRCIALFQAEVESPARDKESTGLRHVAFMVGSGRPRTSAGASARAWRRVPLRGSRQCTLGLRAGSGRQRRRVDDVRAVIVRVVGLLLALCLLGFQQGEEARGAVDELTLEQQVGQLLVLSFSGTTAPEYVREALRERRVAGVILFGGNITGPSQLRELTGALRARGWTPDRRGRSGGRIGAAAALGGAARSSAGAASPRNRARRRGCSSTTAARRRSHGHARAGRRRAECSRSRPCRTRLLERSASGERRHACSSARLAIRRGRRDREALPRHRRRAGEHRRRDRHHPPLARRARCGRPSTVRRSDRARASRS